VANRTPALLDDPKMAGSSPRLTSQARTRRGLLVRAWEAPSLTRPGRRFCFVRVRPGAVSAPTRNPGGARSVSTARLRWLWPTFRDGTGSGVSRGVAIILFVIMPGVRT
jgi:hypothetical protein